MAIKLLLLVEDNADDEALMLRAFKKLGVVCKVDIARDGSEALDYLFCTGAHLGRDDCVMPAVVLLDHKLPKVDGLEVLRRLRETESTARLPVVVLTSSGLDGDLSQAYKLGANSYVRKPVDFGEFSEAVRQMATYWLVLNRTAPV